MRTPKSCGYTDPLALASQLSRMRYTIAELCKYTQLLVASFFSRSDPSQNSIRRLVAIIAYQIYSHSPNLRNSILGALERDPLMFSKSLIHQVRHLITEPLLTLRHVGNNKHPTSNRLIIIDGLDECVDPMAQRDILDVCWMSLQQRYTSTICHPSSPSPDVRSSTFPSHSMPVYYGSYPLALRSMNHTFRTMTPDSFSVINPKKSSQHIAFDHIFL